LDSSVWKTASLLGTCFLHANESNASKGELDDEKGNRKEAAKRDLHQVVYMICTPYLGKVMNEACPGMSLWLEG